MKVYGNFNSYLTLCYVKAIYTVCHYDSKIQFTQTTYALFSWILFSEQYRNGLIHGPPSLSLCGRYYRWMKGIEDRYWVPLAKFRFGPLDLRSHRVAGLRNFVSEDIEVRDRIQVVLVVLAPVDNDLHLAEKTDQVENSDGRLHDPVTHY